MLESDSCPTSFRPNYSQKHLPCNTVHVLTTGLRVCQDDGLLSLCFRSNSDTESLNRDNAFDNKRQGDVKDDVSKGTISTVRVARVWTTRLLTSPT